MHAFDIVSSSEMLPQQPNKIRQNGLGIFSLEIAQNLQQWTKNKCVMNVFFFT